MSEASHRRSALRRDERTLGIECPRCGAPSGVPCRSPTRGAKPPARPHIERRHAWLAQRAPDESDTQPAPADLVAVAEVACMAGVEEVTVRTWVQRGILPPPVRVVGADPLIWRRRVIERWLRDTGRSQ